MTLTTHSGRLVNPLDLRVEDIDIEDIAHALANLNRFGGHTKFPISVATHSIHVSMLCPDHPLDGLLHDAAEAYLVDIPRDLKAEVIMAGYRDAETRAQLVIAEKFDLCLEMPLDVLEADALMGRVEFERGFGIEASVPDAPLVFPVKWDVAKFRFLEVYRALMAGAKI